MPAAAPQARRILRSAGDTRMTWPNSEPIAPPVTMIGPSAPNGRAGADGDRRRERLGDGRAGGDAALLGEHRLHRLGDAVAPDHRRPLGEQADDERRRATATTTSRGLAWRWVNDGGWKPRWPNMATLVIRAMRCSSTQAAPPPASQPDGASRGESAMRRGGRRPVHRGKIVSCDDMASGHTEAAPSGLTDEDFARLLAFRDGLRALPALERGAGAARRASRRRSTSCCWPCGATARTPSLGDVADHLLLRHHSAVELVDRAVRAGLVERVPTLTTTVSSASTAHRGGRPQAARPGSAAHLEELSRIGPRFAALWSHLPD